MDLEHPEITQIRKTGYPTRQPENTNIQEHHTTQKDIEQMTLQELIDMGADINIGFHDLKNKTDAEKKLEPFKSIGDVEPWTGIDGHTKWLEIGNGYVDITAFYKEEK